MKIVGYSSWISIIMSFVSKYVYILSPFLILLHELELLVWCWTIVVNGILALFLTLMENLIINFSSLILVWCYLLLYVFSMKLKNSLYFLFVYIFDHEWILLASIWQSSLVLHTWNKSSFIVVNNSHYALLVEVL